MAGRLKDSFDVMQVGGRYIRRMERRATPSQPEGEWRIAAVLACTFERLQQGVLHHFLRDVAAAGEAQRQRPCGAFELPVHGLECREVAVLQALHQAGIHVLPEGRWHVHDTRMHQRAKWLHREEEWCRECAARVRF